MCIYVCVWGCLDKYISVATWPPQTKIPGSAPDKRISIYNIEPPNLYDSYVLIKYELIFLTNFLSFLLDVPL